MSTYSNTPTDSWNLPAVSPLAVLLTTVAFVVAVWLLLAPGPDGSLTPSQVDGAWPFVDQEVEVHCPGGSPTVDVDGVRYALSGSGPNLEALTLDMSDDVWLSRDNGVKVSLGPVTAAATEICAGA